MKLEGEKWLAQGHPASKREGQGELSFVRGHSPSFLPFPYHGQEWGQNSCLVF